MIKDKHYLESGLPLDFQGLENESLREISIKASHLYTIKFSLPPQYLASILGMMKGLKVLELHNWTFKKD